MRNGFILGSLFLTVILAGCTQKDSGGAISGLTPEESRSLNSDRNVFETAGDPPITAETHYAAGQLAEARGEYALAAKQYAEAIKLNPSHKKSVFRMGVCLSHARKHNEAAVAWRKYIELTGGEPAGYSNLGFCYELSNKIDLAEAAYKDGIARDPKSVPCRTNYGLMLVRLGRYGEATIQLQSVLSEAEVHYNIASVLESQGRKEQAKVEYRKALELDPTLLDAKFRLAAIE